MLTLLAQVLDPTEIAVMQLLWARGPMTIGEVCHTLPPERRLHYLTVLTTLRRLAEKQVLRREPLGAAAHAPYCYTPRLSRADVLAALEAVDLVVVFEEDTPLELIRQVRPAVLVKGSDYAKKDVVGHDIVEADGGEVILIDLVPGHSTSSMVARSGGSAKTGT